MITQMSSTRLIKLREVSGGRITRQNLFDAALHPSTVQNYSRLLLRFLEWLASRGIASIHLLTPGALDLQLCDYFEDNINSVQPSYDNMRMTFWALLHQFPFLGQRRLLTESFCFIKKWEKVHERKQKVPIPWLVVILVARLAVERGLFLEAIAFLLLGHVWVRISNLCGLTKADVSADLRTLHPSYPVMLLRLRKTKTGPNKSVTVDRDDMAELLKGVILAMGNTEGPLFPFSNGYLNEVLHALLVELHLDQFGWTLHCFRGGGATEATLMGVPFDQILRRGTWRSSISADIYISTSLALSVFNQIPVHLLQYAKLFEHDLTSIFVLDP